MQEAYVRAFTHLADWDGRARFSAWLLRIAVHEALAQLRRSRRLEHLDAGDEVDGGDGMEKAEQEVPGPEARAFTWLHVDGAFGLWARASRALAPVARGTERADSWATDGHKWPNLPYDCGIALVAHPEPHLRAMAIHAAYLPESSDTRLRNPFDWSPELSRRARGFALYAGLMQLGRQGVEALVDRTCAHARRLRDRLARLDGVSVLNEVELNQVLVRFADPRGGDADAHTRSVVARLQADGTCFATGTVWRGLSALRISVSNWSTDEEDIERTVEAIARAHGPASSASRHGA